VARDDLVTTTSARLGPPRRAPVETVSHSVNRFTITIDATAGEFRQQYEREVPPVPMEDLRALAACDAPWQEMVALMASAAPLGFAIYHTIDADPFVRFAGDRAYCVSYLMGNHTIAERMFRHDPAILLYAPLRTAIWEDAKGPVYFSFDQPSEQFRSFGNPAITVVGVELDRKMAALLEHLGLTVPDALCTSAA
jgi:hypothetical protein